MTAQLAGSDNPTQVVLPGQAAAPDGPNDPFMMYLMHYAFRRDLYQFARTAPRTPVDDHATWQALHKRWALFRDTLHHHHTGEDQWLWPLLGSRSSAAEQQTLAEMEAEHGVIDPLLAAGDAGFARLAAGADDAARLELADTLRRTHDRLIAHLAHEETDALALVQRHLSPQEWTDLEAKFGEDSSLTDLFRVAPWAIKGLDGGDLRSVRTHVPKPVWLIARLCLRRFTAADRRAFRYDPDATR
ncbi:hemerythrin domain-containing protein [Gordonia tangerina]|uniref:Hemerythrin domain-containing protein n=1 Tax=Gordonia tangerina TaxID=2911060 RepID=A0ABS9DSU2_9ACTN|nr:hemerythrin domain-containing protein [Gordonia tangerina]MCF3941011.1 hemerythrin domain-containing protein [Gordonia tangerina]